VAQRVSLYLTDLGFDGDRPMVGDPGVGVGGWGSFEQPTVELEPHAITPARFTITVPEDAEPGDHIGAVVVESQPTASGDVQVVKRVASRLYVTVPGDASASVDIESIDVRLQGALLPRRADVVVVVRNTGATGLDTEVTVNGHPLQGATRVVTRSAERYAGEVPVSVLGGRVGFHVVVDTSGPTAEETKTILVVPWWSGVALFIGGLGFLTLRELRRRLR
jgi:hypothetical protein